MSGTFQASVSVSVHLGDRVIYSLQEVEGVTKLGIEGSPGVFMFNYVIVNGKAIFPWGQVTPLPSI